MAHEFAAEPARPACGRHSRSSGRVCCGRQYATTIASHTAALTIPWRRAEALTVLRGRIRHVAAVVSHHIHCRMTKLPLASALVAFTCSSQGSSDLTWQPQLDNHHPPAHAFSLHHTPSPTLVTSIVGDGRLRDYTCSALSRDHFDCDARVNKRHHPSTAPKGTKLVARELRPYPPPP